MKVRLPALAGLVVLVGAAVAFGIGCRGEHEPMSKPKGKPEVAKTDAEWRALLTPEQYRVMREKGTEAPGTGKYWRTTTPGEYKCAGCGEVLFTSEAKFDSGCGWPSFFQPADAANVAESRDTSHGMIRTEVTCGRCGAHLGHVFEDGPNPTGLRYCINSASLNLKPNAK